MVHFVNVQCPSCQSGNPERAKFCMECGARFGAPCAQCGTFFLEGARFCVECGAPADAAPETPEDSARTPEKENPGPDRLEPAVMPAAPTSVAARPAREALDPVSYTPHHLARKILRTKGALEGERKQVTVLFADVQESMHLAESVDAETWHGILDDFFSILSEGIHRFEGTINQYTGDGVMALFGAPIAHEDHAPRACYAALHLEAKLNDYADEMRRRHSLNFSVRIGLNSGEVVVGSIGDDLRMDYTAQGHTVGLAARMEALAAPNTTCLTEETAELVRDYFTLKDLGEFELKGVTEPKRAYRLIGAGEALTRLDVSRRRGFSRFVGRDDEMKRLEDAFAQVEGGAKRVVGVVAEAGAGKSRLCYEFIARCRARGVQVFEGHCLAHGQMIPFLPVVEMLRQYFEVNDGDSDRAAREKIAGRMLMIDAELKDTLPLIFDFLGVGDPDSVLPDIEPDARKMRIFEALGRMLRASQAAGMAPEVIVVEDMHWIDGASEMFLKGMIELMSEQTRVLLLINSRPGYDRGWLEGDHYDEIRLAPLDDLAVEEILRDLLGSDPTVGGLAERVRDETGGNPFFVEEVVRTLIETGKLVGEPGEYRLANPYDEVVIPQSVHGVLAARIDRLDATAKDVVETAAVLGKRFSMSLLEEVSSHEPDVLAEALDTLEEGGFLEEVAAYPNRELGFRHPLTQEVAYRTPLGDRRRAVHKRVAEALENDCCIEHVDEKSALLAHHWDNAGEFMPAVKWRRRAAEWTSSRDISESRRHWERVLELLDDCAECTDSYESGIAARGALIEIGWKLGMPIEESERLYESGRDLALARENHGDAIRLQAAFAMAQLFVGRVEQGLVELERAAKASVATEDNELNQQMHSRLAYMNLISGNLEESLELFDQSLELARKGLEAPPDPWMTSPADDRAAWAAAFKTLPLVYLGRYDEASDLLTSSLSKIVEDEDRGTAATLYGFAVTLSWFRGQPDRAVEFASQQLRLANEIGVPTLQSGAADSMGVALMMSGRFEEALDYSRKALRTARESGTLLQSESVFLSNLSAAYSGVGRTEKAIPLGEEAVQKARARRTPLFEIRALLHLGRALRELDPGRAIETLREALEVVERTGARGYEPFLREEMARAYHNAGDDDSCRTETAEAKRLFGANGAPLQRDRVGRADDLCHEGDTPPTVH